MSKLNKSKLNYLLTKWPPSIVITAKELSQQGYSYSLLHKYVLNGWLTKLGNGAYLRVNDQLEWNGGIYTLQKSLHLPVHLGGLTALAEQGLVHYAPFKETVYLYNSANKNILLPRWFKNFFPFVHHYRHHLFEEDCIGLIESSLQKLPLTFASAERAILEVLALVPYSFNYEHAYQLTESLRLLRPELLQQLLEKCCSNKVKRLFLHLAHKTRLPCESELDISRINLGKGKRALGKNGKYDPSYLISVPLLTSEQSIIGDV